MTRNGQKKKENDIVISDGCGGFAFVLCAVIILKAVILDTTNAGLTTIVNELLPYFIMMIILCFTCWLFADRAGGRK